MSTDDTLLSLVTKKVEKYTTRTLRVHFRLASPPSFVPTEWTDLRLSRVCVSEQYDGRRLGTVKNVFLVKT